MAASQAGVCLHTMSIMQVYQPNLLKDLDEGKGVWPDDIKVLHQATDLSLLATKETARAIYRSMAALVVVARLLWLNLLDIKERNRTYLLDASLLHSGLFSDSIN